MLEEFNVQRVFATQRRIKWKDAHYIWSEFVKWAYFIFESQRHIGFGRIGNYGYKIDEKSLKKVPFLFFSEEYLKESCLTSKYHSFVLKPLVKISIPAIAKHLTEVVTEQDVKYFLDYLVDSIEKILADPATSEIKMDLDVMGQLWKRGNEVWFEYVLPPLPPGKERPKQTAMRLFLDKQEKKLTVNKLALMTNRQGMFPKIDKNKFYKQVDLETRRDKQILDERPASKERQSSRERLTSRQNEEKKGFVLRKGKSLTRLNKADNQKSQPPKDFGRTTRINSFNKPDSGSGDTLGWQMMGAGSDPLKKNQDFAKLTNDLKTLMETNFQLPKQIVERSMPVVDIFARTLACPVATQRQNPIVAARIGSNLSVQTQRLNLAKEGITVIERYGETLDKRRQRKKVHMLSGIEQYRLRMKENPSKEQKQLLEAKQENYQRYLRLFNMVEDRNVYMIDEEQLARVLLLIDSKFEKNHQSYNFRQIIEDTLEQIRDDYNHSMKKAIIDYILLDSTEMDRLNVFLRPKAPLFYGEQEDLNSQIYNQASLFRTNSSKIQQKLLKNCANTLVIQKLWYQRYQAKRLIVLPGRLEPYMGIEQFWDHQRLCIKKFRDSIINQWIPTVSQIYKQQISELNRNPTRSALFFQSGATQMHVQIRQLVTRELENYESFLCEYQLRDLNPPDTVVHLERTRNRYENCFLNVRLSHRKDDIYFMDNLDDIETKIVDVVDQIVQFARDIPRPQNLITSTKKLYQMRVPQDYDHVYKRVRSVVSRVVKRNIQNTKKCLQLYSKYSFLLNEMRVVDQWIHKGNHDRREYSLTLSKYRDLYQQLKQDVPYFIRMNMIHVDSSQLKRYLLKVVDDILLRLQKSVYELVIHRNQEIQNQLNRMVTVATSSAYSCQRLVEIQIQVDNYRRTGIKKLQDKHSDLVKWISITLYNTLYPVSDDDLAIIHQTSIFLRTIYDKLDAADSKIFQFRKKLQGDAKKQSKQFHQKLYYLIKQIQTLKEFGSIILKDSAMDLLDNCRKKINNFKANLKDLNRREGLLGIDETDGAKVVQWDKNLKPFQELWVLVRNYTGYSAGWTRESIFKQDSDFITQQTKAMYKSITNLSSNVIIRKIAPLSIKISEDLADQIKSFQKNIPVIAVFSNPGLKVRHFQQISKAISYQGQALSASSNLFLNKVIGLGAAEHIEQLEVISETASKEYMIETTLAKVKKEWENIRFEMKRYKESVINIVTGASIEEIQTLLDDHSLKILTVKGSIYAKTFQTEIDQIQDWLNYTNQMIDYTTRVQSVWMYLEPVMTSPDILKHLSVQGSKFKVVDELWKDITANYTKVQLVREIAKNKKVVPNLKQCHSNLQVVQRGLNSYLQSKRLSFPRFFFLSNEQLLEILSETKDPTRVQPHLRKCFEGIARLQFQEGKIILGMYSSEEEYVAFPNKINTALSRGNVDEWLLQVEQRMCLSVRKQISEARADCEKVPRQERLLKRCAMGVLTVEMTVWTHQLQTAIREQELGTCVAKTQKSLRQVVELIKSSGLAPVHVMTLQALIVLSVHNLDVTRNLQFQKVNSTNQFSWQSQLRYYYPFQKDYNDNVTEVRILNAICTFSHQYLGNTSRLVITPLTDRCYRTLCSAVFLNYGGAPEGPAGTGKTETVKDLAKALACQCVVFNCSDGLDYKAMGKFFKGLAASGAWSCFDEFNRINLEVLSVVAQQILCIQIAKARKEMRLFFEDVQLPLKSNANCFITMNPGYAGRSQLPDNLKALFRSVAMMIPDYAMIAEISLYSYGFEDARNLARKIVTTYKLCSEQLSSQEHYDYGMRAVKSVLIAAGSLKRKYQQMEESSLVLKAINDVNVAKFLAFDLPLFSGITSDLFPNIIPPPINYDRLIQQIEIQYAKLKLTLNPYVISKIVQIYDMILVRHGLMVVGDSYSGKTTSLEVLARALGQCKAEMNENQVQICRINPKSVTMRQLYGYFDQVSHEWFDGVLAVKFRSYASSITAARKWLVLDGPVDAIWIQNMNTVLDDNKKLCLNSGEIIAMSKPMSLIFEPMDLLAASPATVSRCGMIYLEPASLGHEVLFNAWLQRNPWLPDDIRKTLTQYIALFPQFYQQVLLNRPICHVSIFSIITTFLRLFHEQIEKIRFYKQAYPEEFLLIEQKFKGTLVSGIFVYAVVWSFGACVDTPGRKTFDQALKRSLLGEAASGKKRKNASFPQKLTLFDYSFRVNPQNLNYEWIKWVDQIEDKNPPKDTRIHEIIVKTNDIVRYNHFLEAGIHKNYPVLLCGPTGTGKTTLVKAFYSQKLNNRQFGLLEVIFSSRTSCWQVQQQIQGKLDKRGSRWVLGPKGIPKMMVHVDDLNMPVKEQYGAQPAVQVLRQLLDQGGFYDFKEKQKGFKQVTDLLFVFSMGATSNDITPRFLRHLILVSVTNFDEDTLTRIFSTLLGLAFHSHPQQKSLPTLLKYSIELYEECVRKLLPTPAKLHYIFNLRDLWKLIMGICRADRNKVHSQNIGRLWAHEAKRVFMDRLLPGQKHLVDQMITGIGKRWGKNMEVGYFSDILSSSGQRSYEQVGDLQKVHLAVAAALNNYNATSDKPMDLVLFDYALQHILTVLRIIRQPKGNALLVGLGGSGRKSFAQLAAFIAQFTPTSLQITKNYGFPQFREDLKRMFMEIGVKNKNLAFVFSDSQIKQQQFLEDINNLLNIGLIPNIFSNQERVEISESVRRDAVETIGGELTPDRLFGFFCGRIKDQLRLIVCFSPIGESFRSRLRMFPSLVNCTTIDWYQEWPREGLISVGARFLQKTQLRYRVAYVEMLQFLHSSAKGWNKKLKQQLGRHFYVTPTTFIQFIIAFKALLAEKRRENSKMIFKYENGYSKIVSTQLTVEQMKKSLELMKPQLKKAAEDTIMKMEMVKIQKQEADIIMSQISGEERIVLQAVTEANAIKEDCEKQLAIALPKLKAAENALLVLDKNSITELKAMLNPPIAVRFTLQGLCLLIDPNPKQKVKNEKTLKMETDWWGASVRNLSNPRLLNDLVNFNKEGLTEGVVANLGKFLNDPANRDILSVQNVANSSLACESIIQWVNGIYNFYFVNKKVKPKKQSLKLAEQKVRALNLKLETKREELNTANKKVQDLRYELDWAQRNKERLQKQYSECEQSLRRASIIIGSLGGQKVRWLQLSKQYKAQAEELDVLIFLASAQVSYLGPFTQAFRTRILQEWCQKFNQGALKVVNSQAGLVKVLGNPIQIRQWNMNGLPYDNFSVQNGIILYNSRRWPLLIDPQGQANRWLKNQQAYRKVKIIKLSEDNFIRNLQNCIQFGTPVLIQNLGTQISPALTPLLLKQTYKKGATTYLKMGENVLIYSQDFYLYMTTKLRNPHYLPEICTQVVMINFMITQEGLSDQLLALLVSRERPDLEQQKEKLVLESADNKRTLKEIEDQILDILGNSENILADETAINVLSASKDKSIQINQKQKLAEETQILIDKARAGYTLMAEEGSTLFFALTDLANIDSMYQYSLSYFTDLFKMAIDQSEKNQVLPLRLRNLRQYFRLSLVRNISRSLFQKDRLMFSALIALRLENVPSEILRFLLITSSTLPKITISKPRQSWIDPRMWNQLCRLSQVAPFDDLLGTFNNPHAKKLYEEIVTKPDPFSKLLPESYSQLSFTRKILLYKCLRPQKMIEAFTLLVEETLGPEFTRSLPFDLHKIYPDSSPQTPLLFILSPGADPFVAVSNFSKAKDIKLQSVSLGQGQGAIAQRLIKANMQTGGWVVLQNCHLATSWMSSLQKIVEELDNPDQHLHKNFRIWLTSYPTDVFPQSVLQKTLKMTNQPPKGLKDNLLVSYLSDPVNNPSYFESSLFAKPFKRLLYSLCFFHALIQERRKYGPLGWNISYEFTESDLRISCRQLKIYIDNMPGEKEVPFQALKYLIAECNYGGRVTDQNDTRLLLTLLQLFYNKPMLQNEKFSFGESKEYILPINLIQYEDHLSYIQGLPSFGSPELVGLHPNADITKDINESNNLLQSLLSCSSQGSKSNSKGKTQQQEISQIITGILEQSTFPKQFNLQDCLRKYPVLYQESMNTVLNQELSRYNKLVQQIKNTLQQLQKAIKGELIMTADLEKMFKALYQGKIPQLWMGKSYPSLKSLANYFNDLQVRVKFFHQWVLNGIPKQFWISGFFFTQSFLTGVLQNYSRKNKIPVDELGFQFIFKTAEIKKAAVGANIFGLFIEGAGWDHKKQMLKQSEDRELFAACPNIYLKPEKASLLDNEGVYEAPLYKTVLRRGVLSTTGHSTNFVMMIKTPTGVDSAHWVKRGVAFLTQII